MMKIIGGYFNDINKFVVFWIDFVRVKNFEVIVYWNIKKSYKVRLVLRLVLWFWFKGECFFFKLSLF